MKPNQTTLLAVAILASLVAVGTTVANSPLVEVERLKLERAKVELETIKQSIYLEDRYQQERSQNVYTFPSSWSEEKMKRYISLTKEKESIFQKQEGKPP